MEDEKVTGRAETMEDEKVTGRAETMEDEKVTGRAEIIGEKSQLKKNWNIKEMNKDS